MKWSDRRTRPALKIIRLFIPKFSIYKSFIKLILCFFSTWACLFTLPFDFRPPRTIIADPYLVSRIRIGGLMSYELRSYHFPERCLLNNKTGERGQELSDPK